MSTFDSRLQHDEACTNPDVREMLRDLMNHWDEFDRLQRREILIELVSCGCSARGLSEVLPCSAKTILRYIDLADLASYLYLNGEPISASPIGFIPAPSIRERLC